MKYYKTDKFLIIFNPETKVARIKNNVGMKSSILPFEEFQNLEKTEIKKNKFFELLNIYFKSVKDKWVFEYTPYRKLDNFEVDSIGSPSNYQWKNIPKHNMGGYIGDVILVYHHGRVYYFSWSYGGYPQGQLFDIKTKEFVQWCKPKNCAPILNEDTKEIV
jgi:hypothetical protein